EFRASSENPANSTAMIKEAVHEQPEEVIKPSKTAPSRCKIHSEKKKKKNNYLEQDPVTSGTTQISGKTPGRTGWAPTPSKDGGDSKEIEI
ncbi:hypothetical protein RUM43_008655, partial [Polyplax serrata]